MNSAVVEEYKREFQLFLDSHICSTEEALQAEHSRLKNALSITHQAPELEAILLNFVEENEENLERFNLLQRRGEANCTQKFSEIESTLKTFDFQIQTDSSSLKLQSITDKQELCNYFKTFTKALPPTWKALMDTWYSEQVDGFLDDVQTVLRIIRQYQENIHKKIFVDLVCINPKDFSQVHESSLKIAKETELGHQWKQPHLSMYANEAIERIKETFSSRNLKVIEGEIELVDQALETAVKYYKEMMAMALQTNDVGVASNSQIEHFHSLCTKAIADSFFAAPQFSYSYLWKSLEIQTKLARQLQLQLQNFIKPDLNTKANLVNTEQSPPIAAIMPHIRVADITDPGIGIYLGLKMTRLGIYYSNSPHSTTITLPPYITFRKDEILLSDYADTFNPSFEIYRILLSGESISKDLTISNEHFTLRTEEIVSFYLRKVKEAAEVKTGKTLQSCVLSTSAFLPTTSKFILKHSLALAGFKSSKIIHTTTAIGIAHALETSLGPKHHVALIYSTLSQFEVAIAEVSPAKSVVIRRVNSDQYVDKPAQSSLRSLFKWPLSILEFFTGSGKDSSPEGSDIESKLKRSISSMLNALNLEQDHSLTYVLVQGEGQPGHGAIDKNLKVINEEGIVLGAAALDAQIHGNKGPSVAIRYEEVHPFTLVCKGNDKLIKTLVHHNWQVQPFESLASIPVFNGSTWVTLTIEEARGYSKEASTKNDVIIGTYSVAETSRRRGVSKYAFQVHLDSEGLFRVEIKSADKKLPAPITAETHFMTSKQLEKSVENIHSIVQLLTKIEQGNKIVPTATVRTGATKDVVEDPRIKLAHLIRVVKAKLESNHGTNPMIVSMIEERLKRAEEALQNDLIKGIQIQIFIKNLEQAESQLN